MNTGKSFYGILLIKSGSSGLAGVTSRMLLRFSARQANPGDSRGPAVDRPRINNPHSYIVDLYSNSIQSISSIQRSPNHLVIDSFTQEPSGNIPSSHRTTLQYLTNRT